MPPYGIPPRCGNLRKSLSGRTVWALIDHDGRVSSTVSAKLEFPAPPATVWAMLTDPAYLDFKRARVGAFDAAIATVGTSTELTFTRPVSAELPAPAAAIVGSAAHIVEIQDWSAALPDGSRTAELSISVGQAPAKISGTASLQPAAAGSCIAIDLTISVSIPLFGGTAEQMIKAELEKHIQAEQELGRDWLTQR